ncbi:MAG: dTMP kinase [Pirellulaceae bacterium]
MFIVFEGIDGSGKSTQLEMCQTWLESLSRAVTVCRDPGSTELGNRLREILLQRSELRVCYPAEMFLFMSARAQLMAEVVLPALQRNEMVLCDRFLLSTVVYQGHAGELVPEVIREIGQSATLGRNPDLTLVFDAPLEITMRRVGSTRDRMESRGEEYFASVRRGFLDEAARDDSVRIIDGGGDPQDIHREVREVIQTLLDQTPAN